MPSERPGKSGPRIVDAPWYRELHRYHWFVLIVASLGWLFDTMDQQLFNLARRPAIALAPQQTIPEAPQPLPNTPGTRPWCS